MFYEWFIQKFPELINNYYNHDFIKLLKTKKLIKERYINYLIQDTLFLKEYTDLFLKLIVSIRNLSDKEELLHEIYENLITNNENVRLEKWNITNKNIRDSKISTITRDYILFLKSHLSHKNSDLGLIAFAMCPIGYAQIGKIHKNEVQDNEFSEWLEFYNRKSFKKLGDNWIKRTNKIYLTLNEKEQEKAQKIMEKAIHHEINFFNQGI